MIMETRIAQAAIPFVKEMVHDHWLALYAASRGRISFEKAATVRYRQHGGNQTGVLAGVESKEEYYRLRIDLLVRRLEALSQKFGGDETLRSVINEAVAWAHARRRYFIRPSIKEAKIMWLGRAFDPYAVVFELAIAWLPSRIFSLIIKTLK